MACAVAPQDARADRVERAGLDVAARLADEADDPLAQLAGGAVRERDGEDLPRPHALDADQVRDAMREDAGLAAAGAGQDQQRPVGGGDGLGLLGVEARDDARGEDRGPALGASAPRPRVRLGAVRRRGVAVAPAARVPRRLPVAGGRSSGRSPAAEHRPGRPARRDRIGRVRPELGELGRLVRGRAAAFAGSGRSRDSPLNCRWRPLHRRTSSAASCDRAGIDEARPGSPAGSSTFAERRRRRLREDQLEAALDVGVGAAG